MKRTSKKIFGILLAAIVCLGACFVLFACASATGVVIGRNDMPRTVYVEGQDLDLTGGSLTIEYSDGKAETIPLSSPEVTVTGYDKTKPGKQTVTFTYKELSTTIDVTVRARIAPNNVRQVYFVGEPFDFSGGVDVADDSGKTTLVPLSDESITLSGFDSKAAAESQTITVKYASGGVEYTGSYDIRIYGLENSKLKAPNKVSYRTHEKLALNGGYITLTNGDSKYDQTVVLTEAMISGADFSSVTPANSPMTQTVTVTYGGKDYTFDITVTYSDVTALQTKMEGITTTVGSTVPEITKAQGDLAVDCMNAYFKLAAGDRSYIDTAEIENAARVASIYAQGEWTTAFGNHNSTLEISEDRGILFKLESYAAAKTAAADFADDTSAVNKYLDMFKNIVETFPELTIVDKKPADYFSVATKYADGKKDIAGVTDTLVKLYEAVSDVPADWSADGLETYKDKIEAAAKIIIDTEYNTDTYRGFYTLANNWREKKDLLDIIYTYYYNNRSDAKTIETVRKLGNVALPGKLADLYDMVIDAIMEYSNIFQGSDSGRTSDSTFLVYYYEEAIEEAKKIQDAKAEGYSEMYHALYRQLTFDDLLSSGGKPISVTFDELFDFVAGQGYYQLIAPVLDDPTIREVWHDYLAILDIESDAPDSALVNVLDKFINALAALSPGRQNAFLDSINVYRAQYESVSLDLELNYTLMNRIIKSTYRDLFTDAEYGILSDLLKALDNYTLIHYEKGETSNEKNGMRDFLKNVADAKAAYDGLSDKSKFDAHFSDFYNKYVVEIAGKYNADGTLKTPADVTALPKEWQDKFDELAKQTSRVMTAYTRLAPDKPAADHESVYILLFSAYENARAIAADIEANAPAEVKEAYYYLLTLKNDNNEELWTLDQAMRYHAASLGMQYAYLAISVNGKPVWETVSIMDKSEDFRACLGKFSDILWYEEKEGDAPEFAFTADELEALRIEILDYDIDGRRLLFEVQGMQKDKEYYYDVLNKFYKDLFADNEKLMNIVAAIERAEKAYNTFGRFYKSALDYSEEVAIDNSIGFKEEVSGTEDPDPDDPGTEDPDPDEPKTLGEALEKAIEAIEALTDVTGLTEDEQALYDSDLKALYELYQGKLAELKKFEEELKTPSGSDE